MTLDERKIKILSAIINDYIATAEPIGSRTIARRYRIGISPATIRNEMADLEELGYVYQPHTSAGRVPSHKGYRFYVDFLMPNRKLNKKEQTAIKKLFKKRTREFEDLIEETARVISNLTSYTAIFLGPKLDTSRLKFIQINKIDEEKGLILIVTNYGTVTHHILRLPKELTESDLKIMSNILNDRLTDKTLSEITSEEIAAIKNEMIRYNEIFNILLEILQESLEDTQESSKIISMGSSKMLEFPEFQDVKKAKNFLDLLEHQKLMTKILRSKAKPSSITVSIGDENSLDKLHDLSIITADFFLEGKSLGICGIVGPTRMEYSRVIAILNTVMENLTKAISMLL